MGLRAHPKVLREVERIAMKHGVSKSWVLAVMYAELLGIEEQVKYE